MRDILFRGKRTDNGDWIEGYYSVIIDDYMVIFSNDWKRASNCCVLWEIVHRYDFAYFKEEDLGMFLIRNRGGR